MSIQIARTLKKGDIIYECDYGTNIKIEITTDITRTDNGGEVSYKWEAVSDTGDTIDYMISERYPHYGPKLYLDPQY